MKEACTIGAGSTIPPDVEGFGTSVMARCPKEAVRLLVEMALSNKSVAGCLQALGRVLINKEWLDVLGVGLLVDAFPRTNNISGVMWQLTPQFLPEFCNHPAWTLRLFGMDRSESSTQCQKYFLEVLCTLFVDCVRNPQDHIFEACVGYHSARGWPPVEKDKVYSKEKILHPTNCVLRWGGDNKTPWAFGASSGFPSPVVVGLKRTELNTLS